jgi:hypothetical protein
MKTAQLINAIFVLKKIKETQALHFIAERNIITPSIA